MKYNFCLNYEKIIKIFYMDEESKSVLKVVGFEFDELKDVEGSIIPREVLLSDNKYDEVKKLIPELKKNYSSSFMTSLQKNADKSQKFPLINLVRQILNVYDYKMEPIRKSDGYTLEDIFKLRKNILLMILIKMMILKKLILIILWK